MTEPPLGPTRTTPPPFTTVRGTLPTFYLYTRFSPGHDFRGRVPHPFCFLFSLSFCCCHKEVTWGEPPPFFFPHTCLIFFPGPARTPFRWFSIIVSSSPGTWSAFKFFFSSVFLKLRFLGVHFPTPLCFFTDARFPRTPRARLLQRFVWVLTAQPNVDVPSDGE